MNAAFRSFAKLIGDAVALERNPWSANGLPAEERIRRNIAAIIKQLLSEYPQEALSQLRKIT